MNKRLRKLLGLVLGITVLVGSLPSAMAQTTDGYYYKLEETDVKAKNGFAAGAATGTWWSGESTAVQYSTTAPGADGYYMDFEVNIPKTDDYVIYVRGGAGKYSSVPELVLDGATALTLSGTTGTEWGNSYGYNAQVGYHKYETVLEAGTRTLRFRISATAASSANYMTIFDFMLVMPSDYTWTTGISTIPVAPPEPSNSLWLEGENATRTVGGSTTVNATNAGFSGGTVWMLNATSTAPGTDGYYAEFDVSLVDGSYDIYVRGGDDAFGDKWVSNGTLLVDGVEKTYTSVATDGWINSGSNVAYGWMKVTGVTLEETGNKIRWTYTATRTGDTNYIGALDCIAIVPAGTPFAPVAKDIASTVADYEMSTLLADYDLNNITEDLDLPTELADGTTVTWTSDATTVITNNGAVTRPQTGVDATVKLTATAGSLTKEFTVTVKNLNEYEVENFAISGTIGAGQTVTATAKVTKNYGNASDCNLILAVYDSGDQMIDCDVCTLEVSNTGVDFSCQVTIALDEDGASYAKAFVWTDFDELRPILPAVDTLD